jgi:hypothetical protein
MVNIMVEIHYCGRDDQPLCGRVGRSGWLWTASSRAVTCVGCGLLLERQRRREPVLGRPGGLEAVVVPAESA